MWFASFRLLYHRTYALASLYKVIATNKRKRIEQIYQDTTQFDHGPLKRSVDFIFIDAGHEYTMVRSDSLKAMEMIRPGGVILWHDYCFPHPGVGAWLNEMSQTTPLWTVAET